MRASGDPTDRLDKSLNTLVPLNANQAYDMKELILKTVDDGDFFEQRVTDYSKGATTGTWDDVWGKAA